MPTPQTAPIAVLLHLLHTRHLEEFSTAFDNMGHPFELFVNLVEGFNTPQQIRRQRAEILDRYPAATILESENRGMDTGGMFRLFEQIRHSPYKLVFYAHSKSSDRWRQTMLNSLLNKGKELVGAALIDRPETDTPHTGMIGCYSYPFDYYNIDPFLEIMTELEVSLNTDWEPYYQRYPGTRTLSLGQRIAHANDLARLQGKRSQLRPEIDLDYAGKLLGDFHRPEQPITPALLKRLIGDQVTGPLPYFPGNFFWISPAVIQKLASYIDFEKEFAALPLDLTSDIRLQSRAHAWERALPVFTHKKGFSLQTTGRYTL